MQYHTSVIFVIYDTEVLIYKQAVERLLMVEE